MKNAKSIAAQNRWLVLALIWLVFVIHGTDRSVLLVLLEPIRKTFGLNDSEIGFLIGLGYAAPFALAGIPLGALVDRVPKRKTYLAGLLAIWSGLTSLGGLAPSYAVLVLTRACVGATESGAPPTMMSIISDTFDVKSRPAAMSVYYTAPFLGLMIGAILAGHISQHYGWRAAVLLIGAPGILMAVVTAIFLREPIRGRFDPPLQSGTLHQPVTPALQAFLYAFREPQLCRLLIAVALSGFVVAAVSSWVPVLLERVLGFSQQRTGGMMALVSGLPSILGLLAGGAIMSRFGNGQPQRLLRFSGAVMLIGAPLAVVAPLCGMPKLTLALFFSYALINSAYIGPAWSVLVTAIPAPMRGTILGLSIVLTNLVAAGFGPQSTGLLSDALHRLNDPAHLQHAIAALALTALIPIWLFLRSGKMQLRPLEIPSVMQTELF